MRPQRWQVKDFRANRRLLDPEIFLDGSNPPPTDLIEGEVWAGIMDLPDHVSITTSNHHGKLLKILYRLSAAWVEAVGDDEDNLYFPLLDADDEFQIAIFDSLHGYYRPAIGSLRNALELITVAAYTQVCGKSREFASWRAGQIEIPFGKACDELGRAAPVQLLTKHLRTRLNDSLFDQKTKTSKGGWARRLYSELSNYSHSRPNFTDIDLWHSNGPIYVHSAFLFSTEMYVQISALCYILVKLARPNFVLPVAAAQLFRRTTKKWGGVAGTAYTFLFKQGNTNTQYGSG